MTIRLRRGARLQRSHAELGDNQYYNARANPKAGGQIEPLPLLAQSPVLCQ
jgi:hypothetical protein